MTEMIVRKAGKIAGQQRKYGDVLSADDLQGIPAKNMTAMLGSGMIEPKVTISDITLVEKVERLEAKVDALLDKLNVASAPSAKEAKPKPKTKIVKGDTVSFADEEGVGLTGVVERTSPSKGLAYVLVGEDLYELELSELTKEV